MLSLRSFSVIYPKRDISTNMDERVGFLICLIIITCISFSEGQAKGNHCGEKVPCDEGQCIGREKWCDGKTDCFDESDEKYCRTSTWFQIVDNSCTDQHFKCDNAWCVPVVTKCDGYENCKDGSDECGCENSLESFSDSFEYTSLLDLTEATTLDYYSTVISEQNSLQNLQVRNQKVDYNSRPADHQQPTYHVNLRRNFISSTRQEIALPLFHFRHNYTQHFAHRYKDAIQKAESWILDQRDSSYGWGIDTPRALVALSLINNSFLSNVTGNNFMKKTFQMHLGVKLLTELNINNSLKISGNSIKLAQYINALLATCQDPRDFFGQDLVEHLLQMKNDVIKRERFMNPFIYVTLCLVNATITEDDIEILQSLLDAVNPNQRSKDIQIFATTALACLQHNKPELELNVKVEKAFNDLRSKKLRDGSFGNVHSTAIAAQALMSGNIEWDPVQTLDYLKQHQSEDGSFGNMIATYYILPSLCGRSLLHLRSTRCEPPPTDEEGPHIRIFYTVKIGHPPTASIPNYISVPAGTNFFDVLHIAQLLNPVFKFSYYDSNGKTGVHAISGVMNDPEHGFYWHLYELGSQETLFPNRSQEYTGDIRKLYPEDSQELVYWYHNF